MTEKGSKFNINYDILQCVEHYIFLKKNTFSFERCNLKVRYRIDFFVK